MEEAACYISIITEASFLYGTAPVIQGGKLHNLDKKKMLQFQAYLR